MTANELRQKYLEFFKSKGHAIIPSASLIPENDASVLFTTAGMHPLVPYLLGEKHPAGTRLADCQKCIRTGDIEDVGDNRHLTCFEMLGNWSLGDYFKKEAITWSWEFLTSKEWLGLDPKRLFVSVFMGNENSPIDEESINVWKECYESLGIKADVCPYNKKIEGNENYRIFPLTADDNWWGAGETGPCGPCTEMFYDVRPEEGGLKGTFDEEIARYRIMEIWNDVFMEFNQTKPGTFEKLAKANVDTGMGLERTMAVLTGKTDAFDIDVFFPLFQKIEELSGLKYDASESVKKQMRIIADHLRAATFIMGDDKGVTPSNTDQGYVVRRLIRRAIRSGHQLGIKDELWANKVAGVVIENFKHVYPELEHNKAKVFNELDAEEAKFKRTLELGEREAEKIFKKYSGEAEIEGEVEHEKLKTSGEHAQTNLVSGTDAFNLFQSFGFPLEMVEELAREKGLVIDQAGFKAELEKHQELSRTASAGMFKGGLADSSDETKELHTAAHLMLAGLRKVLGGHVSQKGSNITPERLRFDFSHGEKMTPEQIAAVEEFVNDAIDKDLPVKMEELTLEEAKEQGATGAFEHKYGEKVKVYTMGNEDYVASKEICGGPHVDHTGELGRFKIQKEESSSGGVRRIKAVLIK